MARRGSSSGFSFWPLSQSAPDAKPLRVPDTDKSCHWMKGCRAPRIEWHALGFAPGEQPRGDLVLDVPRDSKLKLSLSMACRISLRTWQPHPVSDTAARDVADDTYVWHVPVIAENEYGRVDAASTSMALEFPPLPAQLDTPLRVQWCSRRRAAAGAGTEPVMPSQLVDDSRIALEYVVLLSVSQHAGMTGTFLDRLFASTYWAVLPLPVRATTPPPPALLRSMRNRVDTHARVHARSVFCCIPLPSLSARLHAHVRVPRRAYSLGVPGERLPVNVCLTNRTHSPLSAVSPCYIALMYEVAYATGPGGTGPGALWRDLALVRVLPALAPRKTFTGVVNFPLDRIPGELTSRFDLRHPLRLQWFLVLFADLAHGSRAPLYVKEPILLCPPRAPLDLGVPIDPVLSAARLHHNRLLPSYMRHEYQHEAMLAFQIPSDFADASSSPVLSPYASRHAPQSPAQGALPPDNTEIISEGVPAPPPYESLQHVRDPDMRKSEYFAGASAPALQQHDLLDAPAPGSSTAGDVTGRIVDLDDGDDGDDDETGDAFDQLAHRYVPAPSAPLDSKAP